MSRHNSPSVREMLENGHSPAFALSGKLEYILTQEVRRFYDQHKDLVEQMLADTEAEQRFLALAPGRLIDRSGLLSLLRTGRNLSQLNRCRACHGIGMVRGANGECTRCSGNGIEPISE